MDLSVDSLLNSWNTGYAINNRICYCGASNGKEAGAGVWAFALTDSSSNSNWPNGFNLIK